MFTQPPTAAPLLCSEKNCTSFPLMRCGDVHSLYLLKLQNGFGRPSVHEMRPVYGGQCQLSVQRSKLWENMRNCCCCLKVFLTAPRTLGACDASGFSGRRCWGGEVVCASHLSACSQLSWTLPPPAITPARLSWCPDDDNSLLAINTRVIPLL